MSEAEIASLSIEDGTHAVELAREAVESYVQNGQRLQLGSMEEAFYTRTGALVRLESSRGRGSMRGCAGAYRSSDQLGHVIVDAAIEAASEGSCASEVTPAELPNLTVSVCIIGDHILTNDPAADLDLGEHGVAINDEWLYPTIPVENGWSVEEYLDRTCRKSNLPPGAWREENVAVSVFEGQAFREREPEGSVKRVNGR